MNEQYGLAKLKTNTMSDINIFLVSKISRSEDYTPNIPNIDIQKYEHKHAKNSNRT